MKSQPSKRAQKDKEQSKKESGNPTLVKWNEMNRKQRREMMREMHHEDLSLEVVHPDAWRKLVARAPARQGDCMFLFRRIAPCSSLSRISWESACPP